jgi:hypothetical protein
VYQDLLQEAAVPVHGKGQVEQVDLVAVAQDRAIPEVLAHLQETQRQLQQAQAVAVDLTAAAVAPVQVVLLLSVTQEHK